MRAGGFAGDINSHGDPESPGDGDVGVAAFVEQHLHRYDAVAEQDQDHGAEEFGKKLSGEPVVHRYRILFVSTRRPSILKWPERTSAMASEYRRCSSFKMRAESDSAVSWSSTGTEAWATIGPESTPSSTKCTVHPAIFAPCTSAWCWASRPGNAGSREGWMLRIRWGNSRMK